MAAHLRGVGRGRPPRCPSTCRAPTGGMPSGRSSGSDARRQASARAPPGSWPDFGKPAASRAGLPRLSRHLASGTPVRRPCLEAACDRGTRHRRPLLWLDPVDPPARPRPATAPAKPAARAGASRSRQSSRLPLRPIARLGFAPFRSRRSPRRRAARLRSERGSDPARVMGLA